MDAPTTQTDPTLAHGTLAESADAKVVLVLPGTDYRLHLAVATPPPAKPGDRVTGRIFARARRVDVVGAGGRYIEPVYGRPRRVQGSVVATDRATNTIVVKAVCPFTCELTAGQQAADFKVGQLVSFDVERGARWEAHA
jgi:hypothetical protein